MHAPLSVRQTAPAGDFSRVPSLIAVGVRERHAGHAMGSRGAGAGVVFVGSSGAAAAVAAPVAAVGSLGEVAARTVGYFGGGASHGFDIAVIGIAAAVADCELGNGRDVL